MSETETDAEYIATLTNEEARNAAECYAMALREIADGGFGYATRLASGVLRIGFARPPEQVFEYFRRLHELDDLSADGGRQT